MESSVPVTDESTPSTDAAAFLGITPAEGDGRWRLPVVEGISTAGAFLFGGCALGAAIVAMERDLGRPMVWATAHYLSFANVGEELTLQVIEASRGRYTSQARATGYVGDREIFTVNAGLGSRPSEWDGQWSVRPDVASPEECEVRLPRWAMSNSIMDRLELRIVKGHQWDEIVGNPVADGNSAMWVRMPGLITSAASLAVLGDYVPWGIAQSLGAWTRANSLDNTLRIATIVPTEWVLLDIRIHAIHNGFGHGLVHLWAEDGTLMATASQTAIVRDAVL